MPLENKVLRCFRKVVQIHRNESPEVASAREWKQTARYTKEREPNRRLVGTWNLERLDAEECTALIGAYGHNCWAR